MPSSKKLSIQQAKVSKKYETISSLIVALQEHIVWQKETYGNIDLSRCEHLLGAYTGKDWDMHVTFSKKHYTRYAIRMPEGVTDFDMYLVGWEEHQMSAIHDHADNGCIMKFLSGTVVEERYEKTHDGFTLTNVSEYKEGETAYVPGNIGYHSVGTKRSRAVSLHVYSPATWKTTYYGYAEESTTLSFQKKEALIDGTVSLLKTYLSEIQSGSRKVVDFHYPDQLKEMFDFTLTKDGVGDEEILASIQDVLDKSVATIHPRFFNQLFAGANIYSIMAEWVTAVLNTSMYTYEVGPVFTLMEEYVFGHIASCIGWGKEYDGLMLPGGSYSNLNALQLARYAYNPDINSTGMYASKKIYVLTSDESHYSITKSVMLMGLGKDAVVKIPTNDAGEMIPKVLEQKIIEIRERGDDVFMINATSGTTVLGAYDPLEEISEIGRKYDIWVHADLIRGGAVMFDEILKSKILGISRVDSFSWNPHKMMGASVQCSIFMTQRPDILSTCNVLKTQYLFQEDKGYDIGCDTGDKYTQCGRRVDILKLRLMWKSLGDGGVAHNVRKAFENADYLVKGIEASQSLYLYQKPACTNVCFWYIPTHLSLPHTSHEDNLAYIQEHHDEIHALTAKIKDRMLERGEMMTGYAHTKGYPNFFRMVFMSPEVMGDDIDFVVSHIEELGREIE